jgi:DNA-binding SARP family transcriptional activator
MVEKEKTPMNELKINMFGEFSISTDTTSVSDSDNRSKKPWLLLAYLLCHRDRVVKTNELLDLLWSESERDLNSAGALKTLFYRVRSDLDKLWDGEGKQLILYRNNGYIWNEQIPIALDFEEFNSLCKKLSTQENEDSLDLTIQLLSIYKGEFLSRFSSELWVIPIATHYHNTYISKLLDILPDLLELQRYGEVIDFCRVASVIEPFHEGIHCYWMRALIASKEHKKAVEVYRKLSDRLLSELGIIPSEETRSLYYEAIKSSNDFEISVEMLQEQLKEENSYPGALICEYDFFRVLYYSTARSVLRSGIAVHLALISVKGKKVSEHDSKRWEKIQANLQDTIRSSMRRGDSAARCSASQYVIMLPRANYENSCMVCDRIIKAYYQKHSRLDVDIRYEVFPIQPDEKENFAWRKEPTEE